MSLEQSKAIVFNCNLNGLSIIQDLGRQGVPCVAMDSVRSIGTYSRYAEFVPCPDPAVDESRFVDFLYSYCSRMEAKPVLFPTNDHWAMAVSRHKERLTEVALPCVSDWQAMRQVIDKDVFYSLGQERGYGTPPVYTPSELRDLPRTAFPIAAKPKHRRVSADAADDGYHQAMDRLRLVVIEGPEELEAFLRREEWWLSELVFQKYVPGLSDLMRTIGVYADVRHEVRAVFTGRKVRGYPAGFGDCVVGEVATLPEELVEGVRRIISDLGLTGILEFEYKLDATTGTHFLIEVNPRSWSWVGITSAVGVDIPWTAYRDLSGSLPCTHSATHTNRTDGSVRYVRVVEDALNCLVRYREDHPAWAMGIQAWWRNLHARGRVVRAEFQRDDPIVGIIALLAGAKSLARWVLERRVRRQRV